MGSDISRPQRPRGAIFPILYPVVTSNDSEESDEYGSGESDEDDNEEDEEDDDYDFDPHDYEVYYRKWTEKKRKEEESKRYLQNAGPTIRPATSNFHEIFASEKVAKSKASQKKIPSREASPLFGVKFFMSMKQSEVESLLSRFSNTNGHIFAGKVDAVPNYSTKVPAWLKPFTGEENAFAKSQPSQNLFAECQRSSSAELVPSYLDLAGKPQVANPDFWSSTFDLVLPSPGAKTFHDFPKLPPELRNMIWKLLLPGSRIVKILPKKKLKPIWPDSKDYEKYLLDRNQLELRAKCEEPIGLRINRVTSLEDREQFEGFSIFARSLITEETLLPSLIERRVGLVAAATHCFPNLKDMVICKNTGIHFRPEERLIDWENVALPPKDSLDIRPIYTPVEEERNLYIYQQQLQDQYD